MPELVQIHCSNCQTSFTIDIIVKWCPSCGMMGLTEEQGTVKYERIKDA